LPRLPLDKYPLLYDSLATANISIEIAQSLTLWDVTFTVNIRLPDGTVRRAEAGECSVHVDDVDEATGLVVMQDLGTKDTDDNGQAKWTGLGGFTDIFGTSNRYKVTVTIKQTGDTKSADFWLGKTDYAPKSLSGKDVGIVIQAVPRGTVKAR